MPEVDLQIPAFTRKGMLCAPCIRLAASLPDESRGAKSCDKAEPLDADTNSAPEATLDRRQYNMIATTQAVIQLEQQTWSI